MNLRYFHTLPDHLSDLRFFRMLDRVRSNRARHLRGWEGGERRARRQGASIEFAGHRSYNPGDDLRHLDWHLLGRLDHPYTRTYHEQEYYYVHVLLDTSPSMFGTRDGYRFRLARDIATALSYLTLTREDRLKLACFSVPDTGYRTAGSGYLTGVNRLPSVRRFLSHAHPDGAALFHESLRRYVHRHQRRLNRTFILSDFLCPAPELTDALAGFVPANRHLTLIRLIDPEERVLDASAGPTLVRDMETGREKRVTLDEANSRLYEAEFTRHRETLADFCHRHGARYLEIDTAIPWFDPGCSGSLMEQLADPHTPVL